MTTSWTLTEGPKTREYYVPRVFNELADIFHKYFKFIDNTSKINFLFSDLKSTD